MSPQTCQVLYTCRRLLDRNVLSKVRIPEVTRQIPVKESGSYRREEIGGYKPLYYLYVMMQRIPTFGPCSGSNRSLDAMIHVHLSQRSGNFLIITPK